MYSSRERRQPVNPIVHAKIMEVPDMYWYRSSNMATKWHRNTYRREQKPVLVDASWEEVVEALLYIPRQDPTPRKPVLCHLYRLQNLGLDPFKWPYLRGAFLESNRDSGEPISPEPKQAQTSSGLEPNCAIGGSMKLGNLKRALEMFDEMLERGVSPDVVCYNLLINGLFKKDKSDTSRNPTKNQSCLICFSFLIDAHRASQTGKLVQQA
ncbi:Pentatricopeptide repeat-containing protein [Carex littledalei]|uniref:Pentatricopeptide repeat-containing protein n=1 Tax=Carex littledalei TaxID=544730 RepID=A0A833R6N2_9POAL|nr:Pentatricopeptide repeat-containing protein [Carex littledalei]